MGKVCIPLNEDLLKDKSMSIRVFLYVMGHMRLEDRYSGRWVFDESCLRDVDKVFPDMNKTTLNKRVNRVIGDFFVEDSESGAYQFYENRFKRDYFLFYMDADGLWNMEDMDCNVLLQLCLLYARAYVSGRRTFFSITSLMVGAGCSDSSTTVRSAVKEAVNKLRELGFIEYAPGEQRKLELLKVKV